MSKLKVYGYYLMNLITRGLNTKKGEVAADSIIPQYGRILTRKYTRKVIVLRQCKVLSKANPQARIFRNELIRKFPGIKVIIHLDNKSTKINVKDMSFLRRFTQVEKKYQLLAQEHEKLDSTEKITGKVYYGMKGRRITITEKDFRRAEEDHYSYNYVAEKVNKNDGVLFDTHYFISILIPDNMLYMQNTIMKEAESICYQLGAEYSLLTSNTNKYLSMHSLTTVTHDVRTFPKMLFSEENIALNSSFTSPGMVGSGGVIPLGMNILSYMPLPVNFFNSPGAKVGMILGESGSGKTFVSHMMIFNFICQNIHCSYLDIKGNEGILLKNLGIPCIEFVMDNKTGCYVETLRIDDMVTGNETQDELEDILDMAITGTVKILATMVNLQPNEGNPIDLENILRSAVGKVYSNLTGFNKYIASTYKLTSELSYSNVLEIVRSFAKEAVRNQEDAANYDITTANMCRLIVKRCSGFVENYDDTTARFKKPITLAQVINTPLVIYSMMKNANTQYSVEDTLSIFMIQYLDIKKQFVRKKRGLHTAAFYEEVQRCGNMQSMMDYIAAMVTGARSNNLAIFLLLNAISVFDENNAFRAIKSNITINIIGKIKTEDVKTLIDSFDCGDISDYLYKINPRIEDIEDLARKGREDFSRVFALKFRKNETEYDKAMFKVIVPKEISEKLRTATTI